MMKVQKGREHSHLFGNTRYCTHHMGVTLIEGGEWLVTEKGRCRRWICAACNERRIERKFSIGQGGIPAVRSASEQPAPPFSDDAVKDGRL